jgi:hypothetical protein
VSVVLKEERRWLVQLDAGTEAETEGPPAINQSSSERTVAGILGSAWHPCLAWKEGECRHPWKWLSGSGCWKALEGHPWKRGTLGTVATLGRR